jgi:hypothetical protein
LEKSLLLIGSAVFPPGAIAMTDRKGMTAISSLGIAVRDEKHTKIKKNK